MEERKKMGKKWLFLSHNWDKANMGPQQNIRIGISIRIINKKWEIKNKIIKMVR